MQAAAKRVLPPTVQTDLNGLSREFRDSSPRSTSCSCWCCGVFIFLVLAAQFESFIDPFIIMLTVPLVDDRRARWRCWLAGGTLEHLQQDRAGDAGGPHHQARHPDRGVRQPAAGAGQERSIEAVDEAAVLRLRPILMTTGAMVLGAVPLAFATGAGAESRHQIGWVIVGGMLLGTLLHALRGADRLHAPRAPPQDLRRPPRRGGQGRRRHAGARSRRLNQPAAVEAVFRCRTWLTFQSASAHRNLPLRSR